MASISGLYIAAVLLIVVGMVLQAMAQKEEFLRAHNSERRSVGVKGLVWDDRVAMYARRYGERQRDHANCAMRHSGGPYGENLFWTSASSVSPRAAVKAWISEKQFYNYRANRCAPGRVCGHYTQVVWANSLRLGCASIACNNNRGTFVICNYDPPGNWAGQRPYAPLDPQQAPLDPLVETA